MSDKETILLLLFICIGYELFSRYLFDFFKLSYPKMMKPTVQLKVQIWMNKVSTFLWMFFTISLLFYLHKLIF